MTIKFGALFIAYQDISDTLVGILMRAKKRRRIVYEGESWSCLRSILRGS
jgi:hypothetical protein